jgi:branched-chain amino acid transport system ATP-binding protein
MSAALLHAKGVSISFGGLKALHDVHLELRPNEVVGVIGPNGAGKTTLFNAMCGLVKPDSGKFEFEGKERSWPRTDELINLGISRTLQGVGLFPELTVLENVMVGAQKLAKTGLISAALGTKHLIAFMQAAWPTAARILWHIQIPNESLLHGHLFQNQKS